ncbi:hypothetical protein RUND412_001824 [Rhizina undulata]
MTIRNEPDGPLDSGASFLQCPYYVHHSTEHVNCRRLVFTQLSRLKIHIKIHYRPVQCSKCGKRFATRYELKRHLEERKHPCAAKKFERMRDEEQGRHQRLEAATSYHEIDNILFPQGATDIGKIEDAAWRGAFESDPVRTTLPEYGEFPCQPNDNSDIAALPPNGISADYSHLFYFPFDDAMETNFSSSQENIDFNPLRSSAWCSEPFPGVPGFPIGVSHSLPQQCFAKDAIGQPFSQVLDEQADLLQFSQFFLGPAPAPLVMGGYFGHEDRSSASLNRR